MPRRGRRFRPIKKKASSNPRADAQAHFEVLSADNIASTIFELYCMIETFMTQNKVTPISMGAESKVKEVKVPDGMNMRGTSRNLYGTRVVKIEIPWISIHLAEMDGCTILMGIVKILGEERQHPLYLEHACSCHKHGNDNNNNTVVKNFTMTKEGVAELLEYHTHLHPTYAKMCELLRIFVGNDISKVIAGYVKN